LPAVPLKTYLPDGDIDLSIFCNYNDAAAIKDNWAQRLHAKLEEEQRSQSAPFTIGDIQVINAEVGARGSLSGGCRCIWRDSHTG
jgi:hypothetical protein